MKKSINCIALTLIAGMLYYSANAQGIAMNDNLKENELYAPAGNTARTSEVNSKILRNFYKSYGDRPDAKWSKTDNGFAVSFKNDEMRTNVYYKNTGAVDYSINYYSEDQLPKDVRHLVNSNFENYTIKQASEVHKNGAVGYYVKIEDKYYIKTVRIMNEELETTETLIKR